MTAHGKESGERRTPRSFDPHQQPSEEDLLELREPYNLPMPEYPWLPGPPKFVVVLDQRRDLSPDQPRSLFEILESIRTRTPDPEPDWEAEP